MPRRVYGGDACMPTVRAAKTPHKWATSLFRWVASDFIYLANVAILRDHLILGYQGASRLGHARHTHRFG